MANRISKNLLYVEFALKEYYITIYNERFYGDNNHKRREAFYKRSDEGHTQDFNSVPFMGMY